MDFRGAEFESGATDLVGVILSIHVILASSVEWGVNTPIRVSELDSGHVEEPGNPSINNVYC